MFVCLPVNYQLLYVRAMTHVCLSAVNYQLLCVRAMTYVCLYVCKLSVAVC